MTDLLREWAAAERIAIMAEEALRTQLASGRVPSMEMQQNASELRAAADDLFRKVRTLHPPTA